MRLIAGTAWKSGIFAELRIDMQALQEIPYRCSKIA
jgi:hypothetical protein